MTKILRDCRFHDQFERKWQVVKVLLVIHLLSVMSSSFEDVRLRQGLYTLGDSVPSFLQRFVDSSSQVPTIRNWYIPTRVPVESTFLARLSRNVMRTCPGRDTKRSMIPISNGLLNRGGVLEFATGTCDSLTGLETSGTRETSPDSAPRLGRCHVKPEHPRSSSTPERYLC